MNLKQEIKAYIKVLKTKSKEYSDLADEVYQKNTRIIAAEESGVYIGKSEAYEDVANRLEEILK